MSTAASKETKGQQSAAALSPFPGIADYAFLSNCHTAALVAPDGAIDWLCVPSFDSQSVFGSLIDRGAGTFRFGPFGIEHPTARAYEPGTNVLITTWKTPNGWVVVRDALTMGPRRHEDTVTPHTRPPTDDDAEHMLVRTVECIDGRVEVELICEPLFDYGRVPGQWAMTGDDGQTADATGAGLTIRLDSDFNLGIEGNAVRDRLLADAAFGERHVLGDRRCRGDGTPSACRDARPACSPCRAASGWSNSAARWPATATLMMSGAWPPPAPSVWNAWMVRPLNAAMVSSTKPDSFSVSVWIITCTSKRSATDSAAVDRGRRGAPVLVQLQAGGAGADHLLQRGGPRRVALAGEGEVDRQPLGRLQHAREVPRARACRWWRRCRWPDRCRRRSAW